MPIGPLELGIILVIILVIFGPKRLPGLGKSLGSGMREFKESVTGKSKDDDKDEDEDGPTELTAAAQEPAPPAARPAATTDSTATAGPSSEREDAVPQPRG